METRAAAPRWQAHTAAEYNDKMSERCDRLLKEILGDQSRRVAILYDPKPIHRELYSDFTPPGYTEYAGTYRGTAETSLANRISQASSLLNPSTTYSFVSPADVQSSMGALIEHVKGFIGNQRTDDRWGKLLGVTYAFCWFGRIHPFLDGNGHVQRAYFAALATDLGLQISLRFAIHPRPYDRLLALALEMFTTAPGSEWQGELPLVAEYLAFFLDGTFNMPRANLVPGPLED